MSELFEALTARARTHPASPLVTWYGPDGARTELSTVTFATAVAKTAGALVDEWDVAPGSTVRLELPLHWQLPVWLAACDLAGLVVVLTAAPTDVLVTDTAEPGASGPATHQVITATTAFGLPGPPLAAPLLDHARDAMGQPDVYAAPPQDGSWQVGEQLWSTPVIADRARGLVGEAQLGPEDRILVTTDADPVQRALAVWPTPLLTGAAVVLCQSGDPAAIAAIEHVTLRIG